LIENMSVILKSRTYVSLDKGLSYFSS
jgi:hypothetical protein